MAGGGGTRLWPLSTDNNPKQFTKIFDGESLYQKTLKRFSKIADEIRVVTLEKYKKTAEEQAKEIGVDVEIILEPMRKSTMAAIVKAIIGVPMDEYVLVTPSDHAMQKPPKIPKEAFDIDRIVLFGIKPTHPATEYGYINPGNRIKGEVYEIVEFKEKPDENTARQYVQNGYLWNSGLFFFKPFTFVEEMKKHAPIYYKLFIGKACYKDLPELSVDYALIEKTNRLAVVPLKQKWSDLGSYRSLYEYFGGNGKNTVVIGEAIIDNVKGSLIINCREEPICVTEVENRVLVRCNGYTYDGPIKDPKAPKKFSHLK
jgi:mannose-1-phosphate guanylyltransferase/mannose-6-phosphate isomerase